MVVQIIAIVTMRSISSFTLKTGISMKFCIHIQHFFGLVRISSFTLKTGISMKFVFTYNISLVW